MRLSIRDYAAREGISEITVRRRIKRGELVAEQVPTAQGFTYEIVVDDDTDEEPTAPEADHEGDHDQSPPDQVTRQELITELRGQIDYLKQEIEDRKRDQALDRETRTREIDELHQLIHQQGETIRALTQQVEALPERLQPLGAMEVENVRHTYLSQLIGPFAQTALVPLGALLIGSLALVFDVVSQTGWIATAVRFGWIVVLLSVPYEALEMRRLTREWQQQERYKDQLSSTEYDTWYEGMRRRHRNGAIRAGIISAVALIAAIGYTFFDVDLPLL